MTLLAIRGLAVRFGGLAAVSGLDLEVETGRIVSLIGPNGAGKTTVFNAVTGIHDPDEGRIEFGGAALEARAATRTFAGIAAVAGLTGAGLVILRHLEPLWRAAFVKPYRYRQPFPWGHVPREAWRVIAAGGLESAAALLLGLLLGGIGAWIVWRRSRRAPSFVASQGIARTFQNIRLFRGLTVLENVRAAMHGRIRSGIVAQALALPGARREAAALAAEADRLLAFVGLAGRSGRLASGLPYGDQRRLEIARALAARPRLLLLDEPAAGMNPAEADRLLGLLREIRGQGVTIFLIEHQMRVVMGISDRVAVLDHGVKIAEGAPAEVQRNPAVIEAYLGRPEA